MKDKQLDTASFFGQVITMVFVGFFVERVASAYIGEPWGALLTVAVMLAILAGVILWPRLKSKESKEGQAESPGEAAGP